MTENNKTDKRKDCLIRKMDIIFLMTFIISFFMLFIPSVSAIGITPGMTTIDFEAGLQRQGQFTIINSEHKEFNAMIFVQGDLKDSIWIKENIIEFDEATNSIPIDYIINLPAAVEKPGSHTAKIVVMEMPPDTSFEDIAGNAIIATVAVVHQVKIKVPYPGIYAEFEMHISESKVNEITSFIFPVSNLGQEDIQKAKVKIKILSPTNEEIASIETNTDSIKSKERKELVAQWKANVNQGIYYAVATLEYDGKSAKAENTFSVGNLLVDVNDINIKDFKIGGIAKFNIDIESRWNGNIDGIYAEIQIYDKAGNLITSFKSASIDLKPMEKAALNAFWDTEGINIGNYDAKIILYYADKTTERMLKVNVKMDSINTEIIGLTGKVTEEIAKESAAKRTNLFIFILITTLIVINVLWFVKFKKGQKKKPEDKKEIVADKSINVNLKEQKPKKDGKK